MKKTIIAILVVIACIGAFFGIRTLYDSLSENYDANEPIVKNIPDSIGPDVIPANDFEVYDSTGKAVKLSDMKGKPVVVNFWASWCGPCKREMPLFDAAYKAFGDKVEFMMVNLTDGYVDTPESAVEFTKAKGYSFPLYHDVSQNAVRAYRIHSVPMTLFINADGSLYTSHTGAINENTFSAYLDAIMD